MPTRGISIRWLLLGANILALTLPIAAFLGLRIYHTYLLRQTERQLISQSVLIGELWRNSMVDKGLLLPTIEIRPPGEESKPYRPIQPRIDLTSQILPPQPDAADCTVMPDQRFLEAAKSIVPTLKRSQVFNLSAVRLLHIDGCVIGSTRSETYKTLATLPEVKEALNGRYHAVARQRFTDSPLPSLDDIRRRGRYRVFSAVPIFANGKVIGVVRTSRTSLSASRSLWFNRRGLVVSAIASAIFLLVVTLLFARAITRPLRKLRDQAKSIVDGNSFELRNDDSWSPSEFRALSESLTAMTKKLQEKAEYTANYAADVTHELKAPITSIRGASELLIEASNMSKEQQNRFLNNIHADALRMEELVNRLLLLARLENRSAPSSVESIDVIPFFAQILSSYQDKVALIYDNPPKTITIDPLHLSSIITNLVENALEKERIGPVQVVVEQLDGKLFFKVTDFGAAIPKNHQEQIFNRFFTTKKDKGGTGLGLTLTKAIVDQYNGQISFESHEICTSFWVII